MKDRIVISSNEVKKELQSRLYDTTPKEGLHLSEVQTAKIPSTAKSIDEYKPPTRCSQEEFKRMGYKRRLQLMKDDPDEYNRLIGR